MVTQPTFSNGSVAIPYTSLYAAKPYGTPPDGVHDVLCRTCPTHQYLIPQCQNSITTTLIWVEDFLNWSVSHELLGLVDGTFPPPDMTIHDHIGQLHPNLA